MTHNTCIVFVCNKSYFKKFEHTCRQLTSIGRYKGDICLVIGNDLYQHDLLQCDTITYNNVRIQYFQDIEFNDRFYNINNNINTDGRNKTKRFQWHKLHLFNQYFKQWDYILYIDCGMTIFSDISPILSEATPYTLLAHSDAFPSYHWTLGDQFDKDNPIFHEINTLYDLNKDYFQTTLMLYDTQLIKPETFTRLHELSERYSISKTNEQGMIALYFTCIQPSFQQLRLYNANHYLYDYLIP